MCSSRKWSNIGPITSSQFLRTEHVASSSCKIAALNTHIVHTCMITYKHTHQEADINTHDLLSCESCSSSAHVLPHRHTHEIEEYFKRKHSCTYVCTMSVSITSVHALTYVQCRRAVLALRASNSPPTAAKRAPRAHTHNHTVIYLQDNVSSAIL